MGALPDGRQFSKQKAWAARQVLNMTQQCYAPLGTVGEVLGECWSLATNGRSDPYSRSFCYHLQKMCLSLSFPSHSHYSECKVDLVERQVAGILPRRKRG